MKEAVVVIIDANESMATKVAVPADKRKLENEEGRSRFDCAKEASIAILCDLMVRSKANEATVIVLHSEITNNYFYDQDDYKSGSENDDDVEVHCPFPDIAEVSGAPKPDPPAEDSDGGASGGEAKTGSENECCKARCQEWRLRAGRPQAWQ